MTGLVIGDDALFGGIDQPAFAFWAGDDAVDRLFKILMLDNLLVAAGGQDGGFIDQIFKICADQTGGAPITASPYRVQKGYGLGVAITAVDGSGRPTSLSDGGAFGSNAWIDLDRDLLGVFFSIHDPTTLNRQGNDVGTSYRSVIFHHDGEQKKTAEAIIKEITDARIWADPVVTEVTMFAAFYPAEDYHQEYFKKNPYQGYCQAVVAPKVSKFRKQFVESMKK